MGLIFITAGERSVACGRKDKVKTLCNLCVIFTSFAVSLFLPYFLNKTTSVEKDNNNTNLITLLKKVLKK